MKKDESINTDSDKISLNDNFYVVAPILKGKIEKIDNNDFKRFFIKILNDTPTYENKDGHLNFDSRKELRINNKSFLIDGHQIIYQDEYGYKSWGYKHVGKIFDKEVEAIIQQKLKQD